MTDYNELVEALRERAQRENEWYEHGGDIIKAAADAIEALQAEADALVHDIKRYVGINAELTTETEALQAQMPKRGEIVRCKDCKWSISCGYISTRSYAEWKDWFCADGEKMEVQE